MQKMQQIWTLNVLQVVRQHMSRVVANVMQRFVANLTGFPVVKEFQKSVKSWQYYRHKRVAHFWDTVYI